jgi:hypothetical protein
MQHIVAEIFIVIILALPEMAGRGGAPPVRWLGKLPPGMTAAFPQSQRQR